MSTSFPFRIKVKVTKTFYDWETGQRFIGIVTTEKAFKILEKESRNITFTIEDYEKTYGKDSEKYKGVVERINNFIPGKIYFSEFDILEIRKIEKAGGIIDYETLEKEINE